MFSKVWLLVVLALFGTLLALSAEPAAAAQYTNVAGLQSWSAETNYMSLPGYLRWMTFKEQGVWLSMPEAKRIVAQQMMAQ
jgi:hypothetical protein